MKQIFKVGNYFFRNKSRTYTFILSADFSPVFSSWNNIAENRTQISTLNDCVNQAKKLLKCSKRGCQNKLCLEPLGNPVLRNLKVHVRVTENTSNFILSNIFICPFTLNIKSYLQYCSANSMLLFEIEL